MNVRNNDKAVRLMVAEIAGRPVTEVHTVDLEHGHVLINTSFTMDDAAETKRIETEVGKRIGRPVSLT